MPSFQPCLLVPSKQHHHLLSKFKLSMMRMFDIIPQGRRRARRPAGACLRCLSCSALWRSARPPRRRRRRRCCRCILSASASIAIENRLPLYVVFCVLYVDAK